MVNRGGGLVHRGGGVIGAKCWRGGWDPGVMGTYKLFFCSKRNAASVVKICEVVGALNHYKMVKKIELCTLRGNGDVITFQLFLAPQH